MLKLLAGARRGPARSRRCPTAGCWCRCWAAWPTAGRLRSDGAGGGGAWSRRRSRPRLGALAVLVTEDADRLRGRLRLSNVEHQPPCRHGRRLVAHGCRRLVRRGRARRPRLALPARPAAFYRPGAPGLGPFRKRRSPNGLANVRRRCRSAGRSRRCRSSPSTSWRAACRAVQHSVRRCAPPKTPGSTADFPSGAKELGRDRERGDRRRMTKIVRV